MKKIIISLFSISILLFPCFTQAKISHSKIQKEMILARHEVGLSYGYDFNIQLDRIFAKKIINHDNVLFEKYRTTITTYFNKKGNIDNLSKKEKLYMYLLIRSHYELSFRKR